jgi:hypothetical protein
MRGGPDRVWTYADFPRVDRMPLAAALSRLARQGVLSRIQRGVYYRPKTTLFGTSRPDPEILVDAVLRQRGDRPVRGGIEHYSRLGLTTQVSGTITRAARRRASGNVVPGLSVRISSRPLERQRGIRPEERTALDALRDVTRIPGSSPREVLLRLKALLQWRRLDFARLARFARAEPPRVRALLGAMGEDIREESARSARVPARALEALRKGLNPLTTYRCDAEGVLKHAARWRIT